MVSVESYEVTLHVPSVLVALPVIVVPVALHASSASPLKLSPILSSIRPVTVPLVAAYTVSSIGGINVSIKAIVRHNAKNRLNICLISIITFSFFLGCFFFYLLSLSIRDIYLNRL